MVFGFSFYLNIVSHVLFPILLPFRGAEPTWGGWQGLWRSDSSNANLLRMKSVFSPKWEKKNPVTCRLLTCFCMWSEVGSPLLGFCGWPVGPFFPCSSARPTLSEIRFPMRVDLFLASILCFTCLSVLRPAPHCPDYWNYIASLCIWFMVFPL